MLGLLIGFSWFIHAAAFGEPQTANFADALFEAIWPVTTLRNLSELPSATLSFVKLLAWATWPAWPIAAWTFSAPQTDLLAPGNHHSSRRFLRCLGIRRDERSTKTLQEPGAPDAHAVAGHRLCDTPASWCRQHAGCLYPDAVHFHSGLRLAGLECHSLRMAVAPVRNGGTL